MKPVSLLCTLLAGLLLAPWAQAEGGARFAPHAIARSELRPLPPTPAGRAYQLHVHLPASYAQAPQRRYPVLYLTDAYWDFPTVVASYGSMVYDKVLPELIIVGLGYADARLDPDVLRRHDLSPLPLGPQEPDSGHAEAFLATLEQQIMPFVEREYRADPSQRALAGSSLGGLFALYTMYRRPALFQGYIAVSPAVVVGNDWLLGQARAFAQTGQPLPARLYVSGAEHEWPGFLAGIQRYQALLPELRQPGLVFESRTIDGMRHAGTKAEGFARGMGFVFAPLAPETGPSKD
jgi:uncharacterized protein